MQEYGIPLLCFGQRPQVFLQTNRCLQISVEALFRWITQRQRQLRYGMFISSFGGVVITFD